MVPYATVFTFVLCAIIAVAILLDLSGKLRNKFDFKPMSRVYGGALGAAMGCRSSSTVTVIIAGTVLVIILLTVAVLDGRQIMKKTP